jgi:hypothetical protein
MSKEPKLGEMRWTLRLQRRRSLPPAAFAAESDHAYETFLTTRAKAETKQGVAEVNRVTIGGRDVSHVFTIRYTKLKIDVRDRALDALGNMYVILSVEHLDLGMKWIKLHCAQVGASDRSSVT